MKKIFFAVLAAMLLCLAPAAALAVDMQAGTPTFTVNTASPTIVGFGGKQWAVIGHNLSGVASTSGTLTLLLAYDQSYRAFSSSASNEYSGSTLQTEMNTAHSGLLAEEQGLVAVRNLTGGSGNYGSLGYNDDNIAGTPVSNAGFWPLSVNEANLVNGTLREFTSSWWLRSPGDLNHFAAYVIHSGSVSDSGSNVSMPFGVRPAFNLNLSDVLFTSAASGANVKPPTVSAALTAATTTSGAVKFTVENPFLSLSSTVTTVGTVAAGDTVSIPYTGATTGANKYVSCVIVDGGYDVLFYGKLMDCVSSNANGTAGFIVPTKGDMPDGSYTIRLFNEECNGNNETDFAGTPVDIPMTVVNLPTVTTVTPTGAGAAISGNVVITFDEAMDTATTGTVRLSGLPVLTGGSWSAGNTVFTIAYAGLENNTAYTVNISGFKDVAGNTMAAISSHSFTTEADNLSSGSSSGCNAFGLAALALALPAILRRKR